MWQQTVGVLTCIGLIGGGLAFQDTRHVMASEYQDFQWSVLKQQIRDLREDIENEGDPERVEEWELDLEELLDLFCRKYADDRECRKR